jgi:Transposase, Mutator family
VIEEMNDWQVRPLDEVYAAVFIDAIVVKVRDGQVANRPFYAAIGVTLAGDSRSAGSSVDQRDREFERPLPASDQGPRPLPERVGRTEVSLPGDPITGPTGAGQARWTMR